jgi:hypothetical protein
MSNLTREVPLPILLHPRVSSITSLAATRGSYRGLLLMIVVTPACMPRFHTSQEWRMVQYNEMIAFLPSQTFSHLSLVKPLGICGLHP